MMSTVDQVLFSPGQGAYVSMALLYHQVPKERVKCSSIFGYAARVELTLEIENVS